MIPLREFMTILEWDRQGLSIPPLSGVRCPLRIECGLREIQCPAVAPSQHSVGQCVRPHRRRRLECRETVSRPAATAEPRDFPL